MIGTGQVYKISSEHTDKCYIGSTEQTLEQRFNVHKRQKKKSCMSKVLLELGECKIEALEVLYNITKQELKIKEQYYLDLLKDKVLNKRKAYQTKEQKRKQEKENLQRWRTANPEAVKIQWSKRSKESIKKNNDSKKGVKVLCLKCNKEQSYSIFSRHNKICKIIK